MKTSLHRKLESRCRIARRGEGHWILIGSDTFRIPQLGNLVYTTKKVIYAAYVGPVPENTDVRSECGVTKCVRPDHLVLKSSRGKSRALSLPDDLAALGKPEVYQPADKPNLLPEGLTLHTINLIKYLTKRGNPLNHIRAATGLPMQEVVKIRNGVYDQAVENLLTSQERRAAKRAAEKGKVEPTDIPNDSMGQAPLVDKPEINLDELSEEEQAWIRSMG